MVTHELNVFSSIQPQNLYSLHLAKESFVSFNVLMLVYCQLDGLWFQLLDLLENWDCVVYSFDYCLLFTHEQLAFWMHLGFLCWEKVPDHNLNSLYFSWLFCLSVWDPYNCPKPLKQLTCREDYSLPLQFFATSQLSLGPDQHSRKADFGSWVYLEVTYFCTRTFNSE